MFIVLLLLRSVPPEFVEQPALRLGHAAPLEQIRSAQPGTPQRLLQPPAFDLRVVPREQHRRHRFALVHLRPRVLRTIEQPVCERVLRSRKAVTEHPRQLPYHRIDQHHRREFAARDDVVADRDLVVDGAANQTLVDTLVAPAQKDEPRFLCEGGYLRVIHRRPLRREVNHFRSPLLRRFRRRDRALQRLGEHHHAGPAAVRPIIDRAVIVRREITRIPQR